MKTGTIYYNGTDITGIKLDKGLRRKMQIVFQDPYSSLHPRKKIKNIIGWGLKTHHLLKSGRQIEAKVEEFLNLVGMSKEHLYRYPHDLSLTRLFTEKTAVMYLGGLTEWGKTEDIFRNPVHPYSRALISVTPKLDPGKRRKRILLKGEIPSPINPPKGCRFHTRCPVKIGTLCEREVPRLTEMEDGHFVACHLIG